MFSRRAVIGLGLLGSVACIRSVASALTSGKGQFRGRVVTEWLPNGRDMQLIQPIEYIDSLGVLWPVPGGTVVDGASIPLAATLMLTQLLDATR